MEADPLELDTLTPSNDAIIVDRKDDMFIQHGGCATRIVFKEVEEMNVDQFLEDLRIHPNGPEDTVTVVRSPSTQTMMLLRGDRVIRYNGCEFQDVLADTMIQQLIVQECSLNYTPMSKYPLVHVFVQGDRWVTVYVPNHIVHFFGDNTLGYIEDDIMMPPLWYCVQMTSTYSAGACWVAVVDKLDPDPTNCVLRNLCFPNTYRNCSICFGQTVNRSMKYDKMTESIAVSTAVDRLLNSTHNNHTLHEFSSFFPTCREVYDGLEKLPKYEKAIKEVANDGLTANFLRYLRILHEPDGWMRVDLPKVNQIPMQNTFLRGTR